MRRFLTSLLLLPAVVFGAEAPPRVDHHQHLLSPAMVALTPGQQPITAAKLIAMLDAAGIRRAVLLSNAYRFGSPNESTVANEYALVISENEWTVREAAKYPGRLVAFCSFNPLKEYALDELARCARDPRFGRGIKLQFGNSDVDLDNPADVALLRRVFRAANTARLAIVAHVRPSEARQRAYGAAQALVILDELLAVAPDVPVQIAHLAGGGGGIADAAADAALGVFTAALARQDPRVQHLYFDLAGVASGDDWRPHGPAIAQRIREIGVARILFGSDGGDPTDPPARAQVAAFRELPLTADELRVIAGNVAPYLAPGFAAKKK